MGTNVPDIEIFIVVKWMVIIVLGTAIMTLTSLYIKRWWYGNPNYNRRKEDNDHTRGWLDRFVELQRETNKAITDLSVKMNEVNGTLKSNGEALRDLAKTWQCSYEEKRGQKHG